MVEQVTIDMLSEFQLKRERSVWRCIFGDLMRTALIDPEQGTVTDAEPCCI